MKRINDKDLEWLIDQIRKNIRCSYDNEYRHGLYQMIDNCLDELKERRSCPPMIISDVCQKKIKRIVDNEIRDLVKLEITCPYCGKYYSIDKLSNFPEDRNE